MGNEAPDNPVEKRVHELNQKVLLAAWEDGPPLDDVREILQLVVALVPAWSFVDDRYGGRALLGPMFAPLARLEFLTAWKTTSPWRWSLTRLVSCEELDTARCPGPLLAVGMVGEALRRHTIRRERRCPGCERPILLACRREIVVVPGACVFQECLLAESHVGACFPVCEGCLKEAVDEYGDPEKWNKRTARPVVVLR